MLRDISPASAGNSPLGARRRRRRQFVCASPSGVYPEPIFEGGQALTSCAMLAEGAPGPKPELILLGVVVLIILLAIAFAAGYFTRDYVSRKRRAEARRWREYTEPDWLPAATPANTNEVSPLATGELGQMLDRWESRARSRRTG